MDGIIKKIVFLFLFLAVFSCKKEDKPNVKNDDLVIEGRNLLRQYSNVLIDSVEQFDVRPDNVKKDIPTLTIGVIDSIPKRKMKSYQGRSDGHTFAVFKLEKQDFREFKSPYKLNLVKMKNNDANILFVTFSELSINGNNAYVVVKKVRGIGMVEHTYYFKKENGIWVFVKKRLSKMG